MTSPGSRGVVLERRARSPHAERPFDLIRACLTAEEGAEREVRRREWLVGTGVTVGILATVASTPLSDRLTGEAILALSVGAVAYGLSRVCTSHARRPRWPSLLGTSGPGMHDALAEALERRRLWLRRSTLLSIFALAAVGSVPLLAVVRADSETRLGAAHLSYRVTTDSIFTALEGWRLRAHSPGRVSIYGWNGGRYRLLSEGRAAADSTGVLTLHQTVRDRDLAAYPRIFLAAEWQDQEDTTRVRRETVTVERPIR